MIDVVKKLINKQLSLFKQFFSLFLKRFRKQLSLLKNEIIFVKSFKLSFFKNLLRNFSKNSSKFFKLCLLKSVNVYKKSLLFYNFANLTILA